MRRWKRMVALVAAVIALASCGGLPTRDGTESTSVQIGAAHTGVSTTKIAATPRLLWSKHFGDGRVLSVPIIVGELVVVAMKPPSSTPPAAPSSVVVAYDRRTGAQRWVHQHAANGDVHLAYADQHVIVSGPLKDLSALDLHTGELLWSTAVDGVFLPPPTVFGRQVFLTDESSDGPRLKSFDLDTGTQRWSTVVDDETDAVPGRDRRRRLPDRGGERDDEARAVGRPCALASPVRWHRRGRRPCRPSQRSGVRGGLLR